MDIAMNEQAVQVEQKAGRTLMFFISCRIQYRGSGWSTTGRRNGSSVQLSLLFCILHWWLCCSSLSFLFAIHTCCKGAKQGQKRQAAFRLPERALWAIGAIAFCSVIGETAMADWRRGSILPMCYLPIPHLAALGYAAFFTDHDRGTFDR